MYKIKHINELLKDRFQASEPCFQKINIGFLFLIIFLTQMYIQSKQSENVNIPRDRSSYVHLILVIHRLI